MVENYVGFGRFIRGFGGVLLLKGEALSFRACGLRWGGRWGFERGEVWRRVGVDNVVVD